MPANTTSNGVAAAQPASTTGKRFELPLLDFKFGSLTEGTGIPPPPPSPKEEKKAPSPPKTPTNEVAPKKQEAKGAANGHGISPKYEITVTTNAGTKRAADEPPVSPAPSNRGSLRRLLSKTLLNNAYDDQGSISGQGASRPPSRTASTIADDRKAKRTSSWFRRLRSNDHDHDHENDNASKRASTNFEEIKKPAGPPPPMIPELSALETKVDTHLGDDLFKGIK